MDKFGRSVAGLIVKLRPVFVIVFLLLAVGGGIAMVFVKVNFDSSSYLPKDSVTKQGMDAMYEEFGKNGNAAVMFSDVTVAEAVAVKEKIKNTPGVSAVIWLDDLMETVGGFLPETSATPTEQLDYIVHIASIIPAGATTQLEMLSALYGDDRLNTDAGYRDFVSALVKSYTEGGASGFDIAALGGLSSQLKAFYTEKSALFQISFTGSDYDDSTLSAIKTIYTYGKCNFFGNAATTYSSAYVVNTETNKALILVAVIILIILLVSSSSWWEPVIFLVVIGVAVLINMGTNLILGQISYLTQGVACILQLALTMDYSVFLLSRFKQQREAGMDVEEAMIVALTKSFSPISASSLTTVAGFVAIMFMTYTIGFDMGIVLSKGVILSLLSVFLLMPALIIYTHKLIEKTKHKTFNFKFPKLARFLVQSRHFLPILIIIIIGAAFVLQSMNEFTYGNETSMCSEGSLYMEDKAAIEAKFGSQNQIAVLLPKEYYGDELNISKRLLETEGIVSVQSLSLIEELGMKDALPELFLKQFTRENGKYTRLVAYVSVAEEGEETTALIDEINGIIREETGVDKGYFLLGNSPATIEIKELVESDYSIITFISILLVGLVLLGSFRSISIPIILVGVIEGSIWMNMSIPALTGDPLVFLGYLIVSSILLGATIDYAILMASNYMEARRTENRFKAAEIAVNRSSRAIFISAGIFCCAGFAIGFISSMPTIKEFGDTIGRGGLAALFLVMILLPQLLIICDPVIMATTLRAKSLARKNHTYVPRIAKYSACDRINKNQTARIRMRRQTLYEERQYRAEYSKNE